MSEQIHYLSREDISRINLPATQMLDLTEEVLRAKRVGLVEMPAKLGVCPRQDSFLHAMPGYLRGRDQVGLKWVSYYPANADQGIAAIQALIVLNETASGMPVAVLDGNWVTAYRTAAVSALSCRLLGSTRPVRLGIIGNGVQAESHLRVFNEVFPLVSVDVWGPNRDHRTAFVERMRATNNVEINTVDTALAAVSGKDFVVSVTPIGVPPVEQLRYQWLQPGAVVCPVEFDTAWDRELFRKADFLVTDDSNQFQVYQGKGYFPGVPSPEAELADLTASSTLLPDDPGAIKVALNLGVGIIDIAFAQHLYQEALKQNLGTALPR